VNSNKEKEGGKSAENRTEMYVNVRVGEKSRRRESHPYRGREERKESGRKMEEKGYPRRSGGGRERGVEWRERERDMGRG
jgi:hypothetical protein